MAMRKFIAAFLILLGLAPAAAQQFPLTMPANTVYGRLGIGPGPGGAIPFSSLTQNLLPGVGNTGAILRSNGTAWVGTTSTWPDTTTANQILYSSANNTITELTTANSAMLATNTSGIPSLTATPSLVATQNASSIFKLQNASAGTAAQAA